MLKVLNIINTYTKHRIHIPTPLKSKNPTLLCLSSSPCKGKMYKYLSKAFLCITVQMMEQMRHMINYAIKMNMICWFVPFSILDILNLEFAEFIIILVWCPAYTTNPITHSVFLSEEPLSSKFSALTLIFLRYLLRVTEPSNLYIWSFGTSQTAAPSNFYDRPLRERNFRFKNFSATLCLRFVSPSRFLVST